MEEDRPCADGVVRADRLVELGISHDVEDRREGFAQHGTGLLRHFARARDARSRRHRRRYPAMRSPPVTVPPASRASASARCMLSKARRSISGPTSVPPARGSPT